MLKIFFKVPYGKECKIAEIAKKNLLFIARPLDSLRLPEEKAEIKRSFSNPVSSPPISNMSICGKKVVLIGDDITRSTPVDKILPLLIKELQKAGLKQEDMKIVIALGTHRPMKPSEVKSKYGEVVEQVEVVNHDFADREKLVFLEKTKQGTPIWINREVYEAEVRIGIGDIVPHNLAGWTGGAKIIQPGVSGEETTAHTHLISARYDPKDLLGKAENPMRHEMEEVAKSVGLDMIVNTVLNRKGKLIKVFTGNYIKAHREGVKLAEKIYCYTAPSKADIVVASSYPMDIDYWVAAKGIVSGYLALKEGGTIILVTPCHEGVSAGNVHTETFKELGKYSYDMLQQEMEKRTDRDFIAVSVIMVLARIKEKCKVIVVSEGLTDRMCEWLGVAKMDDLQEALRETFSRYGSKAKVAVLTHANLVMKSMT